MSVNSGRLLMLPVLICRVMGQGEKGEGRAVAVAGRVDCCLPCRRAR